MKKLLLLFFLLVSPVYAVETTVIQGPETIFDGTDINPETVISTRIDAITGVFDGVTTIGNLIIRLPGGTPGTNELQIRPEIGKFAIESGFGVIELDSDAGAGAIRLSNIRIGILSGGLRFGLAANAGIRWSNLDDNYLATADLGLDKFGSGILKITNGDSGTGSLRLSGLSAAFRNLSSASETLTIADYFVTCLANDNSVTITFPPVDSDTSQILSVKYVDTGSTNKCYLDGNGSDQIEGFDTYSLLDTFRECATFHSDGSSWWKTGGCQ